MQVYGYYAFVTGMPVVVLKRKNENGDSVGLEVAEVKYVDKLQFVA